MTALTSDVKMHAREDDESQSSHPEDRDSRDLERLSEEGLAEVRAHIAELAAASRPSSGRKSLAGIWKDSGFERIPDLEGEIRGARNELSATIARRRL